MNDETVNRNGTGAAETSPGGVSRRAIFKAGGVAAAVAAAAGTIAGSGAAAAQATNVIGTALPTDLSQGAKFMSWYFDSVGFRTRIKSGQELLIKEALTLAGIDPGYVNTFDDNDLTPLWQELSNVPPIVWEKVDEIWLSVKDPNEIGTQ